jgi:carboxy-cis,cis-muconate cyclase
MYAHDSASGHLTHITSVGSPRGKDAKDGPRHLKIHPNGKFLYCVTEHCKSPLFCLTSRYLIRRAANYVDAYRIQPTTLEYVSSRSLLPRNLSLPQTTSSDHHFRGDTLMLPPSSSRNPNPRLLITTTRGASSDIRGWLSIFPLAANGNFSSLENIEEADPEAERFQTPTSGGKANAIDILPKGEEDGLWILLTDDDEVTASPHGTGAVRVLEWDGWGKGGAKIVAEWPSVSDGTAPSIGSEERENVQGASHAIWLD